MWRRLAGHRRAAALASPGTQPSATTGTRSAPPPNPVASFWALRPTRGCVRPPPPPPYNHGDASSYCVIIFSLMSGCRRGAVLCWCLACDSIYGTPPSLFRLQFFFWPCGLLANLRPQEPIIGRSVTSAKEAGTLERKETRQKIVQTVLDRVRATDHRHSSRCWW